MSIKKMIACIAMMQLYGMVLYAQSSTPQIAGITYGSWTNIAQASGNGWMHFPRAIAYDVSSGGSIVKKALVSWNTSADVVTFNITHGWMGSVNAGVTWNSPAPTNTPNIDLGTAIRRHDGVMITLPFFPANFNGSNPVDSFYFNCDTSADNGVTWHTKVNGGLVHGFAPQLK